MAAPVRVEIVNGVPVESRKAVAPVKPAFIEDKCMKCGKTMVPDDPALCTAPPLREKRPQLSPAEAVAQHRQTMADEEARHLAYKQAYKAERVTRLRASYTRRRQAAAAALVAAPPPGVPS